ncbi:MAG: hypothetical protein PUF13_07115 [Lachnospiraceae bacterium]|nr:hypothetical protein [Lachnospiraceae bacterium]
MRHFETIRVHSINTFITMNYEVASAFDLALQTGSWKEVARSISRCDELLDVTIDGEADNYHHK